jgi:hypothetical protein
VRGADEEGICLSDERYVPVAEPVTAVAVRIMVHRRGGGEQALLDVLGAVAVSLLRVDA